MTGIGVRIGVDRCVGCLECAAVCRPAALRPMPGAWAAEVDVSLCTGCRRCVPACPFGAITVTGEPRSRHQMVVDAVRAALASTCPKGWQVTTSAPAFRCGPDGETAVPDVAVVRSRLPGVEWLGSEEPPVPLAVEVVSAGTRQAALGRNRDLYWQCGVPSYWTVDQRDGLVEVHWSRAAGWYDRWAGFAFA
jgi:ferredoxin